MKQGEVVLKTKKKAVSLSNLKGMKGWVFVSPFILGFLFIFLPIYIDAFRYSLSDIKMLGTGFELIQVQWENYRQALFVNPQFTRTVFESVSRMLTDIPTVIIFSLFVATVLNQKMKGRTIFRAIFFIPVILATGIIEKAELNNLVMNSMNSLSGIDTGDGKVIAGGLLQSLDLQMYLQNMRFSPQLSSFVIGAVQNIYDVISKSGVQMLVFLAGLQSISPSIYESAYMEGATGWESFWKITFPMISPMIFVNIIYTIIDSFTNPLNPIMDMIYTIGFKDSKYGIASAMAWLYFGVIAVCIAVIAATVQRFVFYQQKD